MAEEKVENFKLSQDQISFARDYKHLLKIQKGLLVNLQTSMSEAEQVRGQLQELEQLMGGMADQAPAPNLNELEGQGETAE